jgi:DNA-directed RNA polymerase subunit delta
MPNEGGSDQKTRIINYVYDLLKKNKEPLHYSVLMDKVASEFFVAEANPIQAKAKFYTWLNLDTRFVNLGQGRWGLRNWAPQKKTSSIPLLALMHKSVKYDDSPDNGAGKENVDEDPYAVPGIPDEGDAEEMEDDLGSENEETLNEDK